MMEDLTTVISPVYKAKSICLPVSLFLMQCMVTFFSGSQQNLACSIPISQQWSWVWSWISNYM